MELDAELVNALELAREVDVHRWLLHRHMSELGIARTMPTFATFEPNSNPPADALAEDSELTP